MPAELVVAYVGPGAGIAAVGAALVLVVTILVVVLGLLTFPLRWLVRRLRQRRPERPARARRVVVVGLDGLDPDVVRRFMDEGKMPAFKALSDAGTFSTLKTTCPAMSPVAWSSFATG